MDQYLFASEMALRILRDQEYLSRQQPVSRDRVLCDPVLGKRFLNLAREIAPGFSALDYRWALLTICKRANVDRAETQLSKLSFERLGRRDSIRASCIDEGSGFIWMKCEDKDLYIGHGENIRGLVDRVLNLELDRVSSAGNLFDVLDMRRIEFAVAPCGGLSAGDRDGMKSKLVHSKLPRLNFVQKKASSPLNYIQFPATSSVV